MPESIFGSRCKSRFPLFDRTNISIRSPFSHKRKAEPFSDDTPLLQSKVNVLDTGCLDLPSFQPEALHVRFRVGITSQFTVDVTERQRITRIKQSILDAVSKVGMSDPSEKVSDLLPAPAADSDHGAEEHPRRQALFCGTFGQVRQALVDAELEADPCEKDGFDKAVRLGALFIADPNSKDGTLKLTLWG